MSVVLLLVPFGLFSAEPVAEDRQGEDVFPPALVDFVPYENNPVFTARGEGHWDVKIRERGYILRHGGRYHLWFTGYDGTREGKKMLGYAHSRDGIRWQRHPDNPVYRDHWVEDMMVVVRDGRFYMFAEGRGDRAHLLTSKDGIDWQRQGTLDIRRTNGRPIKPGPFGTPTAWFEDGMWNLFYERRDAGIWLARSKDLEVFRNVQDEPVLKPGQGVHDKDLVALNQIVRHNELYYACYHGTEDRPGPNLWTSNLAVSTDLVHWTKYPGNPLLPIKANKSSNILVRDGAGFRLYTMHDAVHVHFPRGSEPPDSESGR